MNQAFFIIHMIGLGMLFGVGFSHLFIGIASKKWSHDEVISVYSKIIRPLDIMGHSGLGLLIISGLGMLHKYAAALKTMPLLHAKLTLVVILLGTSIYLTRLGKKFVKTHEPALLSKIVTIGKIAHLITLTIVICAVLSFRS
jgi:uncharacterized membrane protein